MLALDITKMREAYARAGLLPTVIGFRTIGEYFNQDGSFIAVSFGDIIPDVTRTVHPVAETSIN